jgi:hypothetical protein
VTSVPLLLHPGLDVSLSDQWWLNIEADLLMLDLPFFLRGGSKLIPHAVRQGLRDVWGYPKVVVGQLTCRIMQSPEARIFRRVRDNAVPRVGS